MNKQLAKWGTPEERELSQKLEELSNLQTLLVQRELDLTTLQAELHAFERHYFRVVGVRYAELDEVEAEIADLLSRSSPQNQEMRMRASEARGRANESAHESKIVQETAGHAEKFKPSDILKKLYRDVAKSIHPDLATDDEDRARRQRFMAEANQAYEEGNGLPVSPGSNRAMPENQESDEKQLTPADRQRAVALRSILASRGIELALNVRQEKERYARLL